MIYPLSFPCPEPVEQKCSTGNLVFFCGAVSHCKSLQTNALETVWIMVKGGKCQFTMDQTDLTISRSHLLLRKSEVGISLSYLKILASEFLSFFALCQNTAPSCCWSCLLSEDG